MTERLFIRGQCEPNAPARWAIEHGRAALYDERGERLVAYYTVLQNDLPPWDDGDLGAWMDALIARERAADLPPAITDVESSR